MKLPYTKQEIKYLAVAIAILVLGTAACVVTKNASLMAGVGALIVISGVVFASKDFQSLVISRMRKLAPLRKEFEFTSLIDETEEREKRVLSTQERQNLRSSFDESWEANHTAAINSTRERHHFVEAFIVIVGTFVNGFGQSILEPFIK
jgi:hypothetical protein